MASAIRTRITTPRPPASSPPPRARRSSPGVDVTMNATAGLDHVQRIAKAATADGRLADRVCRFYIDFYESRSGQRLLALHDPIAALVATRPAAIQATFVSGRAVVEGALLERSAVCWRWPRLGDRITRGCEWMQRRAGGRGDDLGPGAAPPGLLSVSRRGSQRVVPCRSTTWRRRRRRARASGPTARRWSRRRGTGATRGEHGCEHTERHHGDDQLAEQPAALALLLDPERAGGAVEQVVGEVGGVLDDVASQPDAGADDVGECAGDGFTGVGDRGHGSGAAHDRPAAMGVRSSNTSTSTASTGAGALEPERSSLLFKPSWRLAPSCGSKR